MRMMQHGESIHSMLPWDLPWWAPDHVVFFGVLYIVLGIIGGGVSIVVLKSIWDTWFSKKEADHH